MNDSARSHTRAVPDLRPLKDHDAGGDVAVRTDITSHQGAQRTDQRARSNRDREGRAVLAADGPNNRIREYDRIVSEPDERPATGDYSTVVDITARSNFDITDDLRRGSDPCRRMNTRDDATAHDQHASSYLERPAPV